MDLGRIKSVASAKLLICVLTYPIYLTEMFQTNDEIV